MGDVGVAGATILALMGLLGKMVSVYDLGDLIIVQITT
jgi:hypothetical protein